MEQLRVEPLAQLLASGLRDVLGFHRHLEGAQRRLCRKARVPFWGSKRKPDIFPTGPRPTG